MRPNHLHMMIEAPGFRKLTTAWYPEGDEFLESDAVFGVKKSLVVVSLTQRACVWGISLTLHWPIETRGCQRRSRGTQARLPEGQLFQAAEA